MRESFRDPHPCNRRIARGGMTLLEIAVAAAIMAVLLSASIQMIRAVSSQQRAAERRVLAIQAAQAISEQIGNLPWDQLAADAVSQIQIPAPVASHLPGATLEVTIEDENEPVAAKRVLVELGWTGPSGQPTEPVRLTSWVFRQP